MTYLDLRELAERYQRMSDAELMDVAGEYDELTEATQSILREEFARRSLQPPLMEDEGIDVVEGRTLVTVGRYRDLPEAFIARSVLENAGIECFLQDENTVRTDWLWSNLIGGARLQVAEEDAAAAVEILSQPIPSSFPVDTGEDFQQPACPQCGSLNVEPNDRGRKVAATSTMLLTVGLPIVVALPLLAAQRSVYYAHVWKCSSCGCIWQYQDEPEPSASSPVN